MADWLWHEGKFSVYPAAHVQRSRKAASYKEKSFIIFLLLFFWRSHLKINQLKDFSNFCFVLWLSCFFLEHSFSSVKNLKSDQLPILCLVVFRMVYFSLSAVALCPKLDWICSEILLHLIIALLRLVFFSGTYTLSTPSCTNNSNCSPAGFIMTKEIINKQVYPIHYLFLSLIVKYLHWLWNWLLNQ